jgi:hypothetical protein
MKCLLPVTAALLLLMAISCKKTDNAGSPEIQVAALQSEEAAPPPDAKQKFYDQIPFKTGKNEWDKKIIRNVELNIEVTDFSNYRNQIRELIEKYEGYIAKEEESSSTYDRRNVMTINVPAADLDETIHSISSLKGKLLARKVSSDDVTAEVFDTRARIEAKKKVRVRYLEMLQKAKNMEEVLQVEREINQIQEHIEGAEGRLDYLNHFSAMSTIQLTFFEVLGPDDSNSVPGYGKRLVLALNDGLSWLANVLIFFAALWPLWIILGAMLIVVKRLRVARVNTPK